MKFTFAQTALFSNKEIENTARELGTYAAFLQEVADSEGYQVPEASINLPFDEQALKECFALKKKMCSTELKYVVNIGIGGSNLGTKAIYDALFGYFDVVEPQRIPKILFADTSDSAFIQKVNKLVSSAHPAEVLLNAVSKSGTTTETVANMEALMHAQPKLMRRVVLTTDEGTALWVAAQKSGVPALTIPKDVGGRFSVFSAVGMFPLMCAGVDVVELLAGAMRMRKLCLSTTVLENPALVSAILLYLHSRTGKIINDNFYFHPELESLGKWYRQLMGESIGKDGIGITPTVSIGSTDLHSVGQLYLGGPKDKFFTFVGVSGHEVKVATHELPELPLRGNDVANTTLEEVMESILLGVKAVYTKNSIPFAQIDFESLSASELGEFMQFKMLEIMYLAKLLKVNAFDQPSVESYKAETRKALKIVSKPFTS